MNAVPGQDCSWITAARPGLYVRTGRRTRRCASLALLGARGARPDRDGQDHFCGPKYLCRPDALVLVGRLPRFDALGWPGCRLSLLETHRPKYSFFLAMSEFQGRLGLCLVGVFGFGGLRRGGVVEVHDQCVCVKGVSLS
jgi:hypothetical protein